MDNQHVKSLFLFWIDIYSILLTDTMVFKKLHKNIKLGFEQTGVGTHEIRATKL